MYNPPLPTNNMQRIAPYYLPKYNDNIEDKQEHLKHIKEQDKIIKRTRITVS